MSKLTSRETTPGCDHNRHEPTRAGVSVPAALCEPARTVVRFTRHHGSPADRAERGTVSVPDRSNLIRIMPAQGGAILIGRLHVITDTRPGRDPLAVVDAALRAGAPVVQVRGNDLTDRELYELTCAVVERCAAHGAMCVVDDRVHVAQSAGADGVHVGAHDLPVAAVHGLLGPVKAGLPSPLGPEGVGRVASAVGIPVIAIAGVTAARVPELLAAGAHGVAVSGAISEADDPFAATEELLRAIDKGAGW